MALIKNEALINEELDPKLVINRLKKEVEDLKNQLAITNNTDISVSLGSDEVDKLRTLVHRFLEDRDVEASLSIGADMRKINFCFKYLKELYTQVSKSKQQQQQPNQQQATVKLVETSLYDNKETKDLKETLKQRDLEISKNNINFWFMRPKKKEISPKVTYKKVTKMYNHR